MRRLLSALLCLLASTALAQQPKTQPVVQTGLVTPGHAAKWYASGVIGDAGPASGATTLNSSYLTELGITNTGTPFCITDALLSSPSGYHQFCIGANALGGGLISYNASPGATKLGINIIINGVIQPFPGAGNGNVVGPVSPAPVGGDIVEWNGGTTVKDSGISIASVAPNLVLAGPGSGSPAAPTFRALTAADLPAGVITNALHSFTSSHPLDPTDCGTTVALSGNVIASLTASAASGFPATCAVIVTNADSAVGSGGHGKFITISGVTFPEYFLYPGQAFALLNVNNTWTLWGAPTRFKLPCNQVTLYTNFNSGSDVGNDGLASSTPLKSVAQAFYEIASNFDYCSTATAQSHVLVQMQTNDTIGVHWGPHDLVGPVSGDGITLDGGGFTLSNTADFDSPLHLFFGAVMYLQNITVVPSVNHPAIGLEHGANLLIQPGVTLTTLAVSTASLLQCRDSNSTIEIVNGLTISGDFGDFMFAAEGCTIRGTGTITLNANILQTGATVVAVTGAHVNFSQITWNLNGFNISGQGYYVATGAQVISKTGNPDTYWPSSIPGTTNCTTTATSIGACGYAQ